MLLFLPTVYYAKLCAVATHKFMLMSLSFILSLAKIFVIKLIRIYTFFHYIASYISEATVKFRL